MWAIVFVRLNLADNCFITHSSSILETGGALAGSIRFRLE